ncbi:hypothetical protein CC1G_01821 [Coprinopsis cinerea okayama7|uniref:Integral membrane protein n=1 Tax=Coprinopsis cinerea (strain Okayama-7 / 130 / ATCC MYA-4618 / FGSC 9003) TaxID=240176 RepID=A8N2R9_COPC7|nr:hypothetical protein CC1G_01821 [Coprinopsis cinerea okayama7\|eukprot:XP_001829141.2 hypothetical protein CC1G_01821 [Coprinopsis cinerea okayama7\
MSLDWLSPARRSFVWFWITICLHLRLVLAYEVAITDKDYSRQACSGMWGGETAYINVTFDKSSQGQVAMVIYEWTDEDYLGKRREGPLNEPLPNIYICTTTALTGGYCNESQLGRFILNLPTGKSINDTSFWSARVQLPASQSSLKPSSISESGFWNNPPNGSFPTPPASEWDSPWKRRNAGDHILSLTRRGEEHEGLYAYSEPIHYPVRKTGYYCVAIVPLNEENQSPAAATGDATATHPPYRANILFKNVFEGQLPATDYPKVTFYFAMFLAYSVIALLWGFLCYRHMQELLPIQYYLSGLVALLVVEMLANWVYYRYLNAHGKGATSTAFLIVVAILDAGRNSMSFFMLLVVSLGLSVVRESLGSTMRKCQALAVAHFIFGILYAIGIVELEMESTSALLLLLFIIPLAFTLSGFLLWIMYSLNATIQQLRARKQRYKLRMFTRLHYILIFAVVVIGAFFVVSSMSFSGRLAEATLAMSDEIAQDEEEAEDYDLQAIQDRSRHREEEDDDAATLVGGRRGPGDSVSGDVVFEIGDEDDDDDDAHKKHKAQRLSGENPDYQPVDGRGGDREEREGLMRRDD